jgi:hypothetical protein
MPYAEQLQTSLQVYLTYSMQYVCKKLWNTATHHFPKEEFVSDKVITQKHVLKKQQWIAACGKKSDVACRLGCYTKILLSVSWGKSVEYRSTTLSYSILDVCEVWLRRDCFTTLQAAQKSILPC